MWIYKGINHKDGDMRKLLYDPKLMPKGLIALVILFILVITLAWATVAAFGRLAASQRDLAAATVELGATTVRLNTYQLSVYYCEQAIVERDAALDVVRGDLNRCIGQLWDNNLIYDNEGGRGDVGLE